MPAAIDLPLAEIQSFCRSHHLRRLSLFGSVLRDDFTADSDIDVLVEFDPAHIPGLAFMDMHYQLAHILGRKVDIHTPDSLSKYFREDVLAEAEVVFDG